jgi:nucleotide-binding universal stress UspA family protein
MKQVIETPPPSENSVGQSSTKSRLGLRHILAPTDFSENSEKAVDYATQLAKLVGAKLTLLHVVPEPSALDYPMEGIPAEEIEAWHKAAAAKLADQVAKAKLDYEQVDSLLTTALHPRDEIVRAATDLWADLLILSTHGYKGWRHVLFGSDAEKILEHAPCPVLVVR